LTKKKTDYIYNEAYYKNYESSIVGLYFVYYINAS